MPDFGYPETANGTDPRRAGFFANTVCHNTVIVDEKKQLESRGRLRGYDAGNFFQFIDADNTEVYPDCSLYRRSVLMANVSPRQVFVIEIFRVNGGKQHDYIVHGTQAKVESTLSLSSPREGTLAGKDVQYGYFYDDARLGSAAYSSVN